MMHATFTMNPQAYDQIVNKQSEVTSLLAKMASENRGPNDAEKGQLDTLKAEVLAIKTEWESAGRKSFLESLGTPKPTGPMILKAGQSFVDVAKAAYPDESDNLSLGRLLKGYISGDWSGAELEMKAMTSTPTSAGGILIPPVLSARIVELARNKMAVAKAGCVFVPLTSASMVMARQTSDVAAGWYVPNAPISESVAAFDSITFTARKMGTLVRVENELLQDASNIAGIIEASIAAAIALEFDRVCLMGTGVVPQPRGIYNTVGVNALTAVGTPTNYDKFVAAIYQVRGANFEPTACLYSSRTGLTLGQLKNTLGDTMEVPGDFDSLPKFCTNQIINNQGVGTDESYSVVGQFDQLAVGLRHGIQVEVSREAADVFGNDQTMIRATWRGDVQVFQPRAFSLMTGIKA